MASSHTSKPLPASSPVTAPLWLSLLAMLPLLAVVALSLSSAVRATPADRAALLVLAIAAAIAFWSPARKYFERDSGEAHNAATFALACAMFIVYNLARRAGPQEGAGLQLPSLPDDKFVFSYATIIVLLGAIISLPFGFKMLGGLARAWLIGAALLAVLALGSFRLLGNHYPIGATEVLDPTPLVHVLMQLVEYVALAVLCALATAHLSVRMWLLRALPIVLLALWARHHFAAPPVEEDE